MLEDIVRYVGVRGHCFQHEKIISGQTLLLVTTYHLFTEDM